MADRGRLRPSFTGQFRRDLERMRKRGKDGAKLKEILELLVESRPRPRRYRDHKLLGQFAGRRECHVEPDWLLIYKVSEDEIVFERTGTHTDLFG